MAAIGDGSDVASSWIWRLAAPEKIKFLIWTACHKTLPMRSMLQTRGMLQSANFPRCTTVSESIMCCLRVAVSLNKYGSLLDLTT